MHFQIKRPKNGRKNICRDNQTTRKVTLIISDLKDDSER